MAYRFGQWRREQFSDYVKPLNKNDYLLTSITSTLEGMGQQVQDIAITKQFSTTDGSLFLRFALTRFSRETGVTIKLAKQNTSALATDNVQTVAKITIPAALTTEQQTTPIIYDIVITPNDSYAQLIFSIDRDSTDLDAAKQPRRWIPGTSFMIQSFGQIQNIIPKLNIENSTKLKQIGVQSRPGLPMCIDGEMIRVGRSGIYEINHGISISFLGFMPNENDHFILDYQY